MDNKILVPKYRKGKKPTRVRKPSRPLDGINRRLLKEQAAQAEKVVAEEVVAEEVVDAPPTRDELEAQATKLGLKFDGRTTDKRLRDRINEAMKEA